MSRKDWYGGPNSYFDCEGEVVVTPGYRFNLIVREMPHRLPRLGCDLRIDEVNRRVSAWRMYLIVDRHDTLFLLASGKANSVVSAIRQAETWLANNHLLHAWLSWRNSGG